MKRKITYLLKDFDEMLKTFLENSKDLQSQVNLLKQKEDIFEEIEKMAKKYDKIINSIKQDKDSDEI
jgi:hypothetical protein